MYIFPKMKPDEKERLEIVEELCDLKGCNLRAAYNFIKTGKPLQEPADRPNPHALSDGVYIVTRKGRAIEYTGEGIALLDDEAIGIGVKQGDRALTVALCDAAEGKKVSLTTLFDPNCSHIPSPIDAMAAGDGKASTKYLHKLLNPDIKLNHGKYIPSMAELSLIYIHRKEINAAMRLVGGDVLLSDWYWSSTSQSEIHGFVINFEQGFVNGFSKMCPKARVRPVSAFNFNR